MISKKEHLKQVNRFHDLVDKVEKGIIDAKENERFDLLQKYFKLTSKVWVVVDNNIENIKDELDRFENGQ